MMTTMTTTSNFGDAIPVQRHSFWRDCHAKTPVRDRCWTRTNGHSAPEAVWRRVTDAGLILAAPVETWHDGAASPLFIGARRLDVRGRRRVRLPRRVRRRRRWGLLFTLERREAGVLPRLRRHPGASVDVLRAAEGRRGGSLVAGGFRTLSTPRSWNSRRVSRAIHSPDAGGLSPCDNGHSEVITAGKTVTEDELNYDRRCTRWNFSITA